MAAAVLLLLVAVELVFTVWCVARLKSYVGRVDMLEGVVSSQGQILAAFAGEVRGKVDGSGSALPVGSPAVAAVAGISRGEVDSAREVLENASEEDISAAMDVLRKLGL